MRLIARFLPIAIALFCVSACVTPEVLVPKSAAVPAGVDFTGQWQLRDANDENTQRLNQADAAAAGGSADILKEAQRARTGRQSRASSGTAVYVFLETGFRLKITQTKFGIFVSFDRAIVEEYRFGENRSVSVGPIVAARVSGWEGEVYVIETLDEDGAKLVEEYRLEDNASRLVRCITLWLKDTRTLDIEQIYDRV